jgi:uncharacterized protein (DUF1778 family)
MSVQSNNAEINIHLRARTEDKKIIDQAASLIGANRSQFMLASALKEAKNILLDQTTFHVDARTFNAIMDWMDEKPSREKREGMKRLSQANPVW